MLRSVDRGAKVLTAQMFEAGENNTIHLPDEFKKYLISLENTGGCCGHVNVCLPEIREVGDELTVYITKNECNRGINFKDCYPCEFLFDAHDSIGYLQFVVDTEQRWRYVRFVQNDP
jgi:hypothetical protein